MQSYREGFEEWKRLLKEMTEDLEWQRSEEMTDIKHCFTAWLEPRFGKIISDECGKAFAAIPGEVELVEDFDGYIIRLGEKVSRVSTATIRNCMARDAYAELDKAVRAAVREVIA